MLYALQMGDSGICRDEKRAVRNTCNDSLVNVTLADMMKADKTAVDIAKTCVPIGSVEYCRQFLRLLGVQEPNPYSYPKSLYTFLHRSVDVRDFRDVPVGWFIKPCLVKLFDGKIKEKDDNLSGNVYCCPPVKFTFEWRYYVLNGEIFGKSRYDDFEEESVAPDSYVKSIIQGFSDAPCGYAIDIGIIDDGRGYCGPALVEVNDGWALGYYRWGDMLEADYVRLITSRWVQIIGC